MENREASGGCLCQTGFEHKLKLSRTCIGQHWSFINLSPADTNALVSAAFRKLHQKGDVLFFQGDAADRMFLLKSGRVKLSKCSEEGNEIIIGFRKAGDFLGENALHEQNTYPLTATCIEDTLVCGFSSRSFEKLVRENPNIGLQVIKNMSQRLSWFAEHSEKLSIATIEDRLFAVLGEIAQEHGVKTEKGVLIQFPLTHEELGFLAGAHRVSITRAMGSLKKTGRIIAANKCLLIVGASGSE